MSAKTVIRYEIVPSTSFMTGSVELAPFSREAKANRDKAKSNDHVPCADTRNWIRSLRDVEDDDPEQANEEVSDHHRGEPRWRLEER